MANVVVIDPVTRIEGHIKVSISVDQVEGRQQIVDAWTGGTLFRGFERILLNRHPWDAHHICARICGVCPVSQGTAAVLALEQVGKVKPSANGVLARNLVGAANFIDSHILSFYHLSLPDYINGPAMAPFQPAWTSDKRPDTRVPEKDTEELNRHYLLALEFRRKAQSLGSIFGGRMPHPSALIPGGITTTIRPERVEQFRKLLRELTAFVNEVYLADVEKLGKIFADYFRLGKGHGHLLAFGAFGSGSDGRENAPFRAGFKPNEGSVAAVDNRAIAEQVAYSWYDDSTNNLKPRFGETIAQYPKDKAYSWSKAPRYDGCACETGPLARLTINGEYSRGISVMDRHVARAQESKKLLATMLTWLEQLAADKSTITESAVPSSGEGEGLTEAPRGALGHWVKVENMKIVRYQVISPTCWNAAPRDSNDVRGPIEEALVGTPIADIAQPVEALRVIHSFDPCTACAVHVLRPGKNKVLATLYDTAK